MLDDLDVSCEYSHAQSSHKEGLHLSKLTTGLANSFDRIVLLTRDPRDVAVSGYHQVTKRLRLPYPGTISDFIRDPCHGVEKAARFNAIWSVAARAHDNILPITYEGMHADAAAVLSRILGFLQTERSVQEIEEAVAKNRFAVLKAREASGDLNSTYRNSMGAISDHPDSMKVRRGKVGNYRDELGAEDVSFCDEVVRRQKSLPAQTGETHY